MRKVLTPFLSLIVQNVSINALASYAQRQRTFSSSVCVATIEAVKVLLCFALAIWLHYRANNLSLLQSTRSVARKLLISQRGEILNSALPALLYAASNNLSFYGISRVDVASYSLVMQLKLLSSALFNSLLYKRRLSAGQWLSLLVLLAGVVLAQVDFAASMETKISPSRQRGFLAIVFACVCSGLAGSLSEQALKKDASVSLFERNVQVGLPALCFSIAALFTNLQELVRISHRGIWYGFDSLVWLIVADSVLGGLLVSHLVKASGSVTKGFASSVAIVATSWIALRFNLGGAPPVSTLQLSAAASLVISATLLFSMAGSTRLGAIRTKKIQ